MSEGGLAKWRTKATRIPILQKGSIAVRVAKYYEWKIFRINHFGTILHPLGNFLGCASRTGLKERTKELFSLAPIALLAVSGNGWATIRGAIHKQSSEAGRFIPLMRV